MSDLIALGFKDTTTADKWVPELQTLQSEGLIDEPLDLLISHVRHPGLR